jgi:hypothetical protein
MASVSDKRFSYFYILLTALYAYRCQTLFRRTKPASQEIDMKTFSKDYGNFFYRTLAAVAIGAPMLLTVAVSQMPEGTVRGDFMGYGLGAVLAALVGALVLRAAYTLGVNKAFSIVTSEPNRSVTA